MSSLPYFSYPCNQAILEEAKEYAKASIDHTVDYAGWGNRNKYLKKERITRGRFAQLWVGEFCGMNDISYEKDLSPPTDADDLDLLIAGRKVDVKSSVYMGMIGQISPGIYEKSCDYYCLIVTNEKCTRVTPIGFVSRQDYLENAVLIRHQEIIPGTTRRQIFHQGSYFLPPGSPTITRFHQTLIAWREEQNMNDQKKYPFPDLQVRPSKIQESILRIGTLEQALIQFTSSVHDRFGALEQNQREMMRLQLRANSPPRNKKANHNNVIDLFTEAK